MMNDGKNIEKKSDEIETENELPKEGRSLFYNFWGRKFSVISFLFILMVFIVMISLKKCDSKYVKYVGPDEIKIIGQ